MEICPPSTSESVYKFKKNIDLSTQPFSSLWSNVNVVEEFGCLEIESRTQELATSG